MARSYVLASDFTVPDAGTVWPILARNTEGLAGLDTQFVYAYESTDQPGRVLVVIGVHTEQPLLDVLRSKTLLGWFDAVGVDDIPAVFAGEAIERIQVDGGPPKSDDEHVVVALARIEAYDEFMQHVRRSARNFARAGIRRTVVFRAFDTPSEVMFLQQIPTEEQAQAWATRADVSEEWLADAGVGVYPSVFVGRLLNSMWLDRSSSDPIETGLD